VRKKPFTTSRDRWGKLSKRKKKKSLPIHRITHGVGGGKAWERGGSSPQPLQGTPCLREGEENGVLGEKRAGAQEEDARRRGVSGAGGFGRAPFKAA